MYEAAAEDTKRLMYAAGDVPQSEQLPETTGVVMAATELYVRELVARLVRRTRTHVIGTGHRSGQRELDALLFLLHRDRRAHDRVEYLLHEHEKAHDLRKRIKGGAEGLDGDGDD